MTDEPGKWDDWELPTSNKNEYTEMFKKLDKDGDGFISAQQAREIFLASKLPNDVLGKIWSLAVRNKDKRLDSDEFALAVFLIKKKQDGELLPAVLPQKLAESAFGPDFNGASKSSFGSSTLGSNSSYAIVVPPKFKDTAPSIGIHVTPSNSNDRKSVNISVLSPSVKLSNSTPPHSNNSTPQPHVQYSVPTPAPQQDDKASLRASAQHAYGHMPTPQQANVANHPENEEPPNYNGLSGQKVDPSHTYGNVGTIINSPSSSGSSGGSLPSNTYGRVTGIPSPQTLNVSEPITEQDFRTIEWVEYETFEGRKYYFNRYTKKTQWDVPQKFVPLAMRGRIDKPSSTGDIPPASSKSVVSPGSRGSVIVNNSNKSMISTSHSVNTATATSTNTNTTFTSLGSANTLSTTGGGSKSQVSGISLPSSGSGPNSNSTLQISNTEIPLTASFKETTKSILNDPDKVEFFKSFLAAESSNKELLFHMAFVGFKEKLQQLGKSDTDDLPDSLVDTAEKIYFTWIHKDATNHIELPKQIASDVSKKFKAKAKNGTKLPSLLFNEAHKEIYSRVEKFHFPKFMKSLFYMGMYNSMMGRGVFELPDELWKAFLVAADGGEEDGWQFVAETKGVLIHKKLFDATSNLNCARGSGILPLSVDEMYTFAVSTDLRKYYEHQFDCLKVIERLGPKTIVCLIQFKRPTGIPFVTPHEFLVLRTEKRLDDGRILVLSRSVVHQDCPETKSFIRSEADVTGWVIRPHSGNTCTVTYVTQGHMKGLPKWAETWVMNKRPLVVHEIRKFVEKELKECKRKGTTPIWRQEAKKLAELEASSSQ